MRMQLLSVAMIVAAGCAGIGVACGSFSSESAGDAGDAGDASGGSDGSDASTADGGDARAPSVGEGGADGGSSDPGVFCGTAGNCDPQREVCCEHLLGGGVGCLAVGLRGACQGVDLQCDDSADCASVAGVCCGLPASDNVSLRETSCFTLAQCKAQQFHVVVCDPAARQDTACSGGATCRIPDGGTYGFCDGLSQF